MLHQNLEVIKHLFRPFVCVRHVQSPVRRALGMPHAFGKIELQAGSVCATLLGICATPSKTTSNSLKRSQLHTHTFATFLQGL